MDKMVTLDMDGESIRFTEDGKMSVVDAISVLSNEGSPDCILEKLKKINPKLETNIETLTFGGESVAVADSQNWEIIQTFLLDYLINSDK